MMTDKHLAFHYQCRARTVREGSNCSRCMPGAPTRLYLPHLHHDASLCVLRGACHEASLLVVVRKCKVDARRNLRGACWWVRLRVPMETVLRYQFPGSITRK